MSEYNVSKYCLIPWSQYQGTQPESQLTTDIQQKHFQTTGPLDSKNVYF